MATSLRVASSLTICLLTVWLSVLTLAAARYADDKLTPHWKRCREIVIRNETRACTASQNADTCSARKAWQSKLQARSDYNCTEDTPHCPEAPRDLNVEVYKTKILRDDSDPNNKLYPGLNVSWKVSQTGPELETEAKTFEVRVSDVPERGTYIALITVNLTSDDYGQDGLASITYDCMYPLPVHSTLPDKPKSYRLHVVVKTLPHDETFANITVDVPEDITTTAPNTTPTPKPTDDSDSAKETTNTPASGYDQSTGQDFQTSAKNVGRVWDLLNKITVDEPLMSGGKNTGGSGSSSADLSPKTNRSTVTGCECDNTKGSGGLQDQQEEIEKMKTEIQKLKAELANFERQLEKLVT